MSTQLFIPWVNLEQERVGWYSLYATVVTPHTGYRPHSLDFGVPDGFSVGSEVFPVILRLQTPSSLERCLPVHIPVQFRATSTGGLPVGGDSGKTHVRAFVMVDNAVVGQALARVPASGIPLMSGVASPAPCERWNWAAWHNQVDGSFHVQGLFEANNLGFAGGLRPAEPPGFDPDELLLRINFSPLDGLWPTLAAFIPVHFIEKKPEHKYQRVQVLYPGEAACQFPVQTIVAAAPQSQTNNDA